MTARSPDPLAPAPQHFPNPAVSINDLPKVEPVALWAECPVCKGEYPQFCSGPCRGTGRVPVGDTCGTSGGYGMSASPAPAKDPLLPYVATDSQADGVKTCIGCGGECVDRCKDDPQFHPPAPTPPAHLPESRLAEIEARISAATPGPWKLWAMDVMADPVGNSNLDDALMIARTSDPHRGLRTWNADFIAHARTDLPALLLAYRAARAEIEMLRSGFMHKALFNSDLAQALCDSSSHMNTLPHADQRPCNYHKQRAKDTVDQLQRRRPIPSLSLPEAATTDE